MMSTRLSSNFLLAELIVTKTGYSNMPDTQSVIKLTLLCFVTLEKIRSIAGRAISVLSGYRSKEVNDSVGGSKTSQHLKGEAADIKCAGLTQLELFKLIVSTLHQVEFDQLIYEYDKNCCHVSYSLGNNRREVMTRKVVNGKYIYTAIDQASLKAL